MEREDQAISTEAVRAELARRDEAAGTVSAIRDIEPGYGAADRHVAPELIGPIVIALGKAGLVAEAPEART